MRADGKAAAKAAVTLTTGAVDEFFTRSHARAQAGPG